MLASSYKATCQCENIQGTTLKLETSPVRSGLTQQLIHYLSTFNHPGPHDVPTFGTIDTKNPAPKWNQAAEVRPGRHSSLPCGTTSKVLPVLIPSEEDDQTEDSHDQ